jgi:hypothetical protein
MQKGQKLKRSIKRPRIEEQWNAKGLRVKDKHNAKGPRIED